MDEPSTSKKIFSVGYAAALQGAGHDINSESVSFYEKEPEGTVGASNFYVAAHGAEGSSHPDVTARFAVKKILYEYFRSHDFVDANKVALALRTASNEIYEYSRVQEEFMGASAVAAAVTDGTIVIGSVGDYYVFIVRQHKVYQITDVQKPAEPETDKEPNPGTDQSATEAPKKNLIGTERDIVIDIYDGIEVKSGDLIIICSSNLLYYIGKKEILETSDGENVKVITEALLNYAEKAGQKTDVSAEVIKIYNEEEIPTVVRNTGDAPADTDLDSELKDLNLKKKSKNRSRSDQYIQKGQNKNDKTPLIVIGVLAIVLLAALTYWLSTSGAWLGTKLFPPKETATATIDPVQASLEALKMTSDAQEIMILSYTPTATSVPTSTPLPTETLIPTEVPTETETNMEETSATPNPDATENNGATAEVMLENTPNAPESVVKDPIVSENDGADMVYVPAGKFTLGSDNTVDANSSPEEMPQVPVYLDAFWIDKTEVTNGQYRKCVDAKECTSSNYMAIYSDNTVDIPVTYVSHDQAETYCKWIGGRLPTEIEWEKAARGTDGRIYPWGNDEPTTDNRLANFPYFVDSETTQGPGLFRAGSLPDGASPYGALDMAGNVWEWTSSLFNADYYQTLSDQAAEEGDMVENPQGSTDGSIYVIRGGSAAETEQNYYLSYLRTTNRGYVNMASSYYIGFRCVIPDK